MTEDEDDIDELVKLFFRICFSHKKCILLWRRQYQDF